jgi:chromosome segregation ATPase
MSASTPTRPTRSPAEPGPLRRAGEDIFLSPRVIDQSTFDQLATLLRQLVEGATAAGETLTRRTLDSQRSLKALVDASPAMEARLEKAARASSALDARLADLERLARQAAGQTRSVTDADIKLDEMVKGKLASFQTRLDDAVAIAIARISAAAEEATGAVRATGQQMLAGVTGARDDLETLAGETLGRIRSAADAARDEVDEAGQRAVDRIIAITKTTTAHADELSAAAERFIKARLDEGVQRIGTEMERGKGRAEAAIARLDEQMSPLITRAAGAADRLQHRFDAIREAAAATLPDIGRLEALCRQASELDARDESGQPAAGSLAAIVAEARELAEAVRTAGADLDTAREDAETARTQLAESMDAAGGWLDRMIAQSESLQDTLRQASQVCDAAEQAIEQRRRELREAVELPREDLERQAQQLAALNAQAAEARTSIEQMLVRCEQVITDLDTAGAAIAREAHAAREAADRATRMVDLSRASAIEPKAGATDLGAQIAQIADLVSTLAAQTGDADAEDDRRSTSRAPRKAKATAAAAPATSKAATPAKAARTGVTKSRRSPGASKKKTARTKSPPRPSS